MLLDVFNINTCAQFLLFVAFLNRFFPFLHGYKPNTLAVGALF